MNGHLSPSDLIHQHSASPPPMACGPLARGMPGRSHLRPGHLLLPCVGRSYPRLRSSFRSLLKCHCVLRPARISHPNHAALRALFFLLAHGTAQSFVKVGPHPPGPANKHSDDIYMVLCPQQVDTYIQEARDGGRNGSLTLTPSDLLGECVSCPVNSGFWAFRGPPRGHSKSPISYNCHPGSSGCVCQATRRQETQCQPDCEMDPGPHRGAGGVCPHRVTQAGPLPGTAIRATG